MKGREGKGKTVPVLCYAFLSHAVSKCSHLSTSYKLLATLNALNFAVTRIWVGYL